MAKYTEEQKEYFEKEYQTLLRLCPKGRESEENTRMIRKAFDLACRAHEGVLRKSGEPYIIHPIEVAKIVAGEIGLGTKSVVCSLMHDVVEDTEYSLEDIEMMFDKKIATIIDGLTKIKSALKTKTEQAENFRKMILTLSEDARVILIKLADRLHNMRTLDHMTREKQLKIAEETRFFFAPLAHRLGLYAIKTELEDLCLKYENPLIYNEINQKLIDTEEKRQHYLNRFTIPMMIKIESLGIDYHITGRPKSIASIWNKMKKKNVAFEDIYDIFAVRVILYNVPQEEEKTMSWRIYSLVTDLYQPNPDRLRDWISTPKENGYEALHTTVMGPEGRWVEVQIRTSRMDEIAERGYAAHWKYKGQSPEEGQLDRWMERLRETLINPHQDAVEFLDSFKLNLYASEIYVFTPKGDLRRLPLGSTVLDFAFEIHSQVGIRTVGAKINNHKTVSLDYKLASGDQVQIITSDKQEPQTSWLDYVQTAKAKTGLRDMLKIERKKKVAMGQELIEQRLRDANIKVGENIYRRLLTGYNLASKSSLFYKFATGQIDVSKLEYFAQKKRENRFLKYWKLGLLNDEPDIDSKYDENGLLLLDDDTEYTIAPCCNPIPGDMIVGFRTDKGLVIHKQNCEKSIYLQSEGILDKIDIKWTKKREQSFLVRLKITGYDRLGIVSDMTKVISEELNVDMRTIHFDSTNKEFNGYIDLYIHNTSHLNSLIDDLGQVKGVKKVARVDKFD